MTKSTLKGDETMGTIVQSDDRRLKSDADKYRLLQARALLVLFERVHHREATDAQELGQWWATRSDDVRKPIDPAAVLTPAELEAAIREIEEQGR